MRLRRKATLCHAVRLLQIEALCHADTLQEESMKKKTVRKLLKERHKARKAPEPYVLPAPFKERIVGMFLADPGRFAGSPREFAWRQLKQSAEERKRREAGA